MSASTKLERPSVRLRRDPADVGRARERARQRRLLVIVAVAGPAIAWWATRYALGEPPSLPSLPSVDPLYLMAGLFFLVLILAMVGTTVVAGRSPHIDGAGRSRSTSGSTTSRAWHRSRRT